MQGLGADADFSDLIARGAVLVSDGRHAEALALYDRILEADPNHVEALNNRGCMMLECRQHGEALRIFDRVLELKPDMATAWRNRATALTAARRLPKAIQSLDRALVLQEDFQEALLDRVRLKLTLNRLGDALADVERALARQPLAANLLNARGEMLARMEKFEDALACFDKALSVEPRMFLALHNRGSMLANLQHYDEAMECFALALARKPDSAETFDNRGMVLAALNRFGEALSDFDSALRIRPELPSANWNVALCQLKLGDFRPGWIGYEWRWQFNSNDLLRRQLPGAVWLGRPELRGKSILLYAEQGLGDTIQFIRYAPLLAAMGADVILEVPASLYVLMHRAAGISRVVVRGEPLPATDFHCPVMSLPLAFGTTLESIPAAIPYLSAGAERIERLISRLPKHDGLRVGVAWSGNAAHKQDRTRSIPLSRLAPLLGLAGVQFVSLQKDVRAEDVEALRESNLVDISADLNDFEDTAAVISSLDLVISADTSVAHLAGALGKPVWILLPHSAEWRWLVDRQDSPWYPTAKLFRQPRTGDWESAVGHAAAELKRIAAQQPRAKTVQAEQIGAAPLDSAGNSELSELLDRGLKLAAQQRNEEALAIFEGIVARDPRHVDALNNRGCMLLELQRADEALASFDQALALRDDYLLGLLNRGSALASLQRHEEAIGTFDDALRLRSDCAEALDNKAAALQALCRFEEAQQCYDDALKIRPEYADANLNQGLCWLRLGRFQPGWVQYQWRLQAKVHGLARKQLQSALWLGKPELRGKSILLYAEQGLGDTVQFMRYAPLLAAMGAHVVLEVPAPLASVMRSLAGVKQVLVRGEPLPPTDFHCPDMSLPLALGTTLESVPADIPYLSADPGDWRAKLGVGKEMLVGLCWRGNPTYKSDRLRSMPLQALEPLLQIPGIRFVSLQKELYAHERLPQLLHPGGDFESTASLIAALDLVVSVDTVWAHWAGAIGKPLWLLLARNSHWCWLTDREDSPWYPTAKLFRQPGAGDWTAVVDRVRSEIAKMQRR